MANKKITLFTKLFAIGRKMAGRKINQSVQNMKPYEIFFHYLNNEQLEDIIDFAEGRKTSIDIQLTIDIKDMKEFDFEHHDILNYLHKQSKMLDNFELYKKLEHMDSQLTRKQNKTKKEKDAHNEIDKHIRCLWMKLVCENKCAYLIDNEFSSIGQENLYDVIMATLLPGFLTLAQIFLHEFDEEYKIRLVSESVSKTIDYAINDRNAFNKILLRDSGRFFFW